ncbi:MAG TPA: glycosyltransferase family 4 protein [Verrucomicrobiae bacterium]|nr:glycosyltransferase family 4 protein [Verrucomicrobiae bacterium]
MNGSTARQFPFGNAVADRPEEQMAKIVRPADLENIAEPRVAVLTAGRDKHYSMDLARALIAAGENFDFICGDEMDEPSLRDDPHINVFNLRGDQSTGAPMKTKIMRVLTYYWRLIRYAATAQPKIFHILWNNKFEWFDRTLLMLYYRAMGKRIVLTAHNINAGERDSTDSFSNRLTLKIQYRLCDNILVHTNKMKTELISEFGVSEKCVTVIPFGINRTVPQTGLTRTQARRQLGLRDNDKTLLFFGNIAPYKGLDNLIFAFKQLIKNDANYRLIIAGRPKGPENYWKQLQQKIAGSGAADHILRHIEYIADDQIELFFKAADVLVLPYVHIFQSGVLFLGYSFGLPVIATDVGSFREEIIEGKTGMICEVSTAALKKTIQDYFESELFRNLEKWRNEIQSYASERYSWSKVATITTGVYAEVLKPKQIEPVSKKSPGLENEMNSVFDA